MRCHRPLDHLSAGGDKGQDGPRQVLGETREKARLPAPPSGDSGHHFDLAFRHGRAVAVAEAGADIGDHGGDLRRLQVIAQEGMAPRPCRMVLTGQPASSRRGFFARTGMVAAPLPPLASAVWQA